MSILYIHIEIMSADYIIVIILPIVTYYNQQIMTLDRSMICRNSNISFDWPMA